MSDSTPIPEPTEFWVTSPEEGLETPESRARCEAHIRWLCRKYQLFRELRSLNIPELAIVLPDEELLDTSPSAVGEPPRDNPNEISPIIVDGRQ